MKKNSDGIPNQDLAKTIASEVPSKSFTFITRKQRLFISEYMKDYNPRSAAIRAGYPPAKATRQAYSLLSKPHIAEYLAEQEAEAANRNKITADYLITRLKNIIDSHGEKTADRIAAIQLVARITGFLRDKQIENKQVVVLQQTGMDVQGQTYTATVIPPPLNQEK